MTTSPIHIDRLCKTYRIYRRPEHRLLQSFLRGRKHLFREHAALKPLSLSIGKGETVGIIGTNGSGKSTLLQLVCGTLSPTSGTIDINGRLSALLELGAGFNPEFTGHENIRLNASILGLSDTEIAAKYDDIVAFSGLEEELLSRPVNTYSSGMYVRLAFAVAVSVEPEILVVDEALAVGDEAFQRKCFARIKALQEKGTTILFVSHSAQTIIELCNRAVLLDHGEMLMDGAPKAVMDTYHRMIYAEPTEREALRQQLVEQGHIDGITSSAAENTPESRMEYKSRGAEITDCSILDKNGHAATTLQTGETYRYAFNVTCTEDIREVRCGMYIKTKSGIELGGGGTADEGGTIPLVKAGESLDVSFTFTCCLRDGTYFINSGVSAVIDGERQFLHRLIDATMFKVLPDGRSELGGMIDFSLQPEITVRQPQKETKANVVEAS